MFATIHFRTYVFPSSVKNLKIKGYNTVILPILCGCETWPLTVKEKHTLRVFENRMCRRILGPKRENMAGGWRRLHDEELNNLCTS
jgi:hypothetical protein